MHGWHAGARIAGAKGLDGKLRLEDASAFLHSATVGSKVAFVPPKEDTVRFATVASVEQTSRNACIAVFAEVNEAALAEGLRGMWVLVEGEGERGCGLEMLDGGLTGYSVFDEREGIIGTVALIDQDRPQPLMVVKDERDGMREAHILIPFVDGIVKDIIHDDRMIHIQAPAGLLDLKEG